MLWRILVALALLSNFTRNAAAGQIIGVRGENSTPIYAASTDGNIYLNWTLQTNIFTRTGIPQTNLAGLAFGCTTLWVVDAAGNAYEGNFDNWRVIDNVFVDTAQTPNGRTVQFMCDADCVMYAVLSTGDVYARSMRYPETGAAHWQLVGTIQGEQPTATIPTTWGRLKSNYRGASSAGR